MNSRLQDLIRRFRASAVFRYSYQTRGVGLLLLALGSYMILQEKELIVKTGHAGSKSAGLPLIIVTGLSFILDPDIRRPWILVTMLILGFLGGVAWWWIWEWPATN